MKRLRRMFVAVTAGAALAYFFTTPRGRRFRSWAADLLQHCCTGHGCSCGTCTPEEEAGFSGGASGSADPAVQAKIDETRRRLREQLKETLAATPPVDTDRPHTETTA